MKNYKKVLAAALAMTMVAGSSVMAAAPSKSYVSGPNANVTSPSDATGTITGGGELEGKVDQDVFHIVVPTSIQGDNASFDGFNFVMDPQMLITKTQAAKYISASTPTADSFVEDKTLYFVNKTDRKLDNTSDYVQVTNKSSIDVAISLKATMVDLGNITMSDTETFADDSTSMYMAVIGGAEKKAIDATDGAEVTGTITKAKTGAYDTVYDKASDSYKYELVNDDAALFSTYEFALTGATNDKGDWLNITDTPSVSLVWKVEPAAAAAPSIPQATYAAPATGDLAITVDLGSGDDLKATGITSVTFTNANNAVKPLAEGTDYTFSGTTLTIKRAAIDAIATNSRKYTVTFNDTAKTTAEVTVTK